MLTRIFRKCIVILRFLRHYARMRHDNQLTAFKTLNMISLSCLKLITMNLLNKLLVLAAIYYLDY